MATTVDLPREPRSPAEQASGRPAPARPDPLGRSEAGASGRPVATCAVPTEARTPPAEVDRTTVVPVPHLTPTKHPTPRPSTKKSPAPAPKTRHPNHLSRPGEPNFTYTSDNNRERERTGARCPGMRVSITITRLPHHSTGVAAAGDRAVTLGVQQEVAMRRPC